MYDITLTSMPSVIREEVFLDPVEADIVELYGRIVLEEKEKQN